MKLPFKIVVICAVLLAGSMGAVGKTITVWVHGTNPAPDFLWTGQYSPFRSWLYAAPGLSLAKELPQNYYFHKLAKQCAKHDESEFSYDFFYTYGWPSTILSAATRKIEGKKLFEQLNAVIEQYRQACGHLKVRLVGFSHGGNVILNMLSCLPFSCLDIDLEVVFLGIPVQELTRKYINNFYVSRALSFYTDADWLQVMDLQALQNWDQNVPWFSQRIFQDDDQVIQIKLTIDGKSIGHRDYRLMNHHLPNMLHKVHAMIEQGQKSGHFALNFLT